MLILLVVAAVLGTYALLFLRVNADITGLAPQEDPKFKDLIKYTSEKLTSNTLVVVLTKVKGKDHDKLASELKELFEKTPYVNQAEPFDNPETLVKYGMLSVGGGTVSETVRYYQSLLNVEPKTLIDFRFWRNTGAALHDMNKFLEEVVTKSGIKKYYLLSPDGDLMVMNFSMNKPMSDVKFVSEAVTTLKSIIKSFEQKYGIVIYFTGGVMGTYESNQQATKDFTLTSIISLLGVLFILLVGFGNVLELAFFFFGLLISMAISMGIIAIVLRELNIVTTFVNAMLLGLGIDYAVYIVTRIQERFNLEGVSKESIVHAFAENFRPSFVSMVTTALAFLTMVFSPSNAIKQMGLSVAIGVFIYFTVFNIVMPIAHMKFLDKFKVRQRETYVRFVDFVRRSKLLMNITILGTLVLAAVGTYSILNFSYTASSLVSKNAESVIAQDIVAQKFGQIGSSDVAIAEVGSEELQKTIEKLIEKGLISSAFSILTFVESPEKVTQQRSDIYVRLLEITHIPILELIFRKYGLYESFVSTLDVLKNVTTTEDLFKIMEKDIPSLFYKSIDGKNYLLAYVSLPFDLWQADNFKRFFDSMKALNIRTYGYSALFYEVINELVRSTVLVLGFVFIVELLVLLLDFKKFGKAFTILVLTVLNGLAAFGFTYLLGIRANFITFIVLPIFLGIGVDSLVELEHSVKYGRESIIKTEKAIIICITTTVASFGSFVLARGQLLREFGLVTAAGLIGTLFISIFWYLNTADKKWRIRAKVNPEQASGK
ncbi:RND transporter [Fervidobacterium thailandense]|uniref:RND transporter n=2 Tax=Fervidobacterium thailandense TaxID=1008305 RepID=A0A1E3G4H1_9BACT|nr:RND transporter [Fervidobacterium thailandense]